MHLAPREIEKLMLHNAGVLAQKRLARGIRLNYPESVSLIATQLLEFIREGRSVSELMDLGRQLLGRMQVMAGVADMIAEVQVEGTFPDGTKLVTVHDPIAAEHGDLELALYGSFLPVPNIRLFSQVEEEDTPVGALLPGEGELILNDGRENVSLKITNTGDRPIQVGSHYHFIETNASLSFDRSLSYGKRLDIPAGTAVRFEPGDTKTVSLVAISGNQVIRGGNSIATGAVSEESQKKAEQEVAHRAFGNQSAE